MASREFPSSDSAAVFGMGSCYALGTFTDNFYKQAAVLLAASTQMTEAQSLATVLFSLPFILFSAWAGWLADRLVKKHIVVAAKTVELLALLAGSALLVRGVWPGILLVIFCMGLQATVFSPALNGSIPEHFPADRVPRVNSLIKLASTAAVLAGIAVAGIFLDLRPAGGDVASSWLGGLFGLTDAQAYGRAAAGVFIIIVAAIGVMTAFVIRSRPPAALGGAALPPFPWLGPVDSVRHVLECRKDGQLFLVLLAEAYFYGIAAIAVISVANLAESLGYSNTVASLLSAILMIGIAAGSLAAGRSTAESWRRLLFPSAAGMGFFLLLVSFAPLFPENASAALSPRLCWLFFSLFASGVCGGLYLIPLASFIQVRPPAHEKGKVLGVSNFLSFVSIAAFGAAFALISLLPPALTFVVYGLATVAFAPLVVGRRLRRFPDLSMKDAAGGPLSLLLRAILSLRYSVRESGLESIPAGPKGRGVLFLPNHPALIDPPMVYSRIAGLSPRPLADERQMTGPVQGMAAKFLRVVTIPDLRKDGRGGGRAVKEGLARIGAALKAGDNVLLYPSGRVYRGTREDLGANSAVAQILAEAPEARVVLVRTTGLWGSSFSYAGGKVPRFMRLLLRGVLDVLANGLFFTPRRQVLIEFAEAADIPRNGDKMRLNRWLEDFYNEAERPALFVPRLFWKKELAPQQRGGVAQEPVSIAQESGSIAQKAGAAARGAKGALPPERAPLPEKDAAAGGSGGISPRGELESFSQISPGSSQEDLESLRPIVYELIRRVADLPGDHPLEPEQTLGGDVGLDSLGFMDLASALEAETGRSVTDLEALVTVGDCVAVAAGLADAGGEAPEGRGPSSWFALDKDPAGAELLAVPKGAATVLEAFLRIVREAPSRPLLADRGGVRTRRQALTGVLALSRRLEALPGARLGVMLPASPAAVVVWLAALMAGKEPVMINWTVGVRNLRHCLALSGVRHAVTASALLDRLEDQGLPVRELPVEWVAADALARELSVREKLAAAARAALHCLGLSRALYGRAVPETAAILFTSGSEASPKAVPLSHANLMINAADVVGALAVRRRDRLLAMLPPFHSFGLMAGLALPAVTGLAAAFHPNPTEAAPLAFLVRDYKLTLLGATPTFLEAMLQRAGGRAGGPPDARENPLASLRFAFVGAEKCPERVYLAFAALCPEAALCEGYGITECSPVVSVNRPGRTRPGSIGELLPSVSAVVVREESLEESSAPVGKAADGAIAADGAGRGARPDGDGALKDAQDRVLRTRVRPGETGMLLVRGPSVFSGYLRGAAASAIGPAHSGGAGGFSASAAFADAFPPDPFVEFEGERWYRTGDLVRQDAEGTLTFVGRLKRFVKLGGEMISLPQMETVLQAALALRPGTPDDGRIHAAVEARPGSEEAGQAEILAFTDLDLTVREVNRAFRDAGLSALYAVKRVVRVGEIPLLGSGKTDYQALKRLV